MNLFLLVFLVFISKANLLVDQIVAVVNNEIISESDILDFKNSMNKPGVIDDLLLNGVSAVQLKNERSDLLNYLINQKILESEVKKNNMSVTIERVEQEIRSIAKRNNVSRSDLLSALKAQGFTTSEYQNFLKNRIERQTLVEQEISSKIRISDDDIASEYQRRNPNLDLGSYEFTLSHILFRPQKGGWEAASERAEVVSKSILSGQSFESLSEQHSEDPNFVNGGLLGTFKAGEFLPEIEKAISNLATGEITKPVRSKTGIHIVKVLGKKVIANPQYEKEKEKIRAELFEASFQKQFRNWLSSKREDYFVRINK